MMVFVISFGAILVGVILVILLAKKQQHVETPEKECYSDEDSLAVRRLINMSRNDFEKLMTDLLTNLGLQIEEKTMTDFGGIDYTVIDPAPIKGGRSLVQCPFLNETKLVDSTYVIRLLDSVK
jgi:hypothetical protein